MFTGNSNAPDPEPDDYVQEWCLPPIDDWSLLAGQGAVGRGFFRTKDQEIPITHVAFHDVPEKCAHHPHLFSHDLTGEGLPPRNPENQAS